MESERDKSIASWGSCGVETRFFFLYTICEPALDLQTVSNRQYLDIVQDHLSAKSFSCYRCLTLPAFIYSPNPSSSRYLRPFLSSLRQLPFALCLILQTSLYLTADLNIHLKIFIHKSTTRMSCRPAICSMSLGVRPFTHLLSSQSD